MMLPVKKQLFLQAGIVTMIMKEILLLSLPISMDTLLLTVNRLFQRSTLFNYWIICLRTIEEFSEQGGYGEYGLVASNRMRGQLIDPATLPYLNLGSYCESSSFLLL